MVKRLGDKNNVFLNSASVFCEKAGFFSKKSCIFREKWLFWTKIQLSKFRGVVSRAKNR